MNKSCIRFAIAALTATALLVGTASAAPKAPKPTNTKMSTPTLACAADATETTINIEVCAGETGAPAGFSLQWMTLAAYLANGEVWLASDDPLLCKASFSGNANASRYNLLPGECTTVNVGEFLFDNGASTNCADALVCGTTYVFRAFAHATSTLNRSDFTSDLTCSTLQCGGGGSGDPDDCTFTQGYWKNHNPLACIADPESPLCVEWPVDSLTLGTVDYSVVELLAILSTPAKGNGLLVLAHQLIAAKLNVAKGATDSAAQAIIDADALIGGLIVPPVGSGWLAPSDTSALALALAQYNEGLTGPGHCN